ncbi:MAG: pyridoxal phosphate-dependent decarboxylase family protein, partial [Gemmatimonadales bacterium]
TAAEPAEALRAWFLGPRAENAAVVERLVLEALRDHVFWRRNFHPEDGLAVHEADRRRPGFDAATARLTEELLGLLAALKRDVPFYSRRYAGHMVGEQTIAAQIGYFAAMLYNPNNVTAEVSPVTTRLELEAAAQLAAMIGYDPKRCWGHLTSGGTVANFEALWIARGVRYLPVALALSARDLGINLQVRVGESGDSDIRPLPLWTLLNLDADATLDAHRKFFEAVAPKEAARALDAHSLSAIGYQDYSRNLQQAFGDELPAGVVLVPATAHYSWEKVVRALGIGARRIFTVPVDAACRMDPDALWRQLIACASERRPVLAVVSVCGSTEEGAIDRLDQIVEIRKRAARELGVTFHLHSDAAFGGYAAAATRAPDSTRMDADRIRSHFGGEWPPDEWTASIAALADADSVTIDPHKLGYVPYPAGAVLVRDRRARALVAIEPPYLAPAGDDAPDEVRFLGRWILEGSKPGAAAAAVWLSHRVIPLDVNGYGFLISRTADAARRFHDALGADALSPFRAVRLTTPDLNLVTWIVTHPSCKSIAEVNALNTAIYDALSPAATDPPYYITRTRLMRPAYDGVLETLIAELGVPDQRGSEDGLVVLRATIMNPFFGEGSPQPDHLHGLVSAVREAAEKAIRSRKVGREGGDGGDEGERWRR